MDNKMIAYCGLNCETCEARIATINNDDNLREEVARKWSEMNGITILKSDINCLGCRMDGIKSPFCDSLCPIRICALKTVSKTCGGCKNLDSCDKIKMIISNNEEAYKTLKETD